MIQMRNKIAKISLAFILFYAMNSVLVSGEKEEHREIANLALKIVLTECKDDLHDLFVEFFFRNDSLIVEKELWDGKSFGKISASFSGKDISVARLHAYRRTILQQLESLPFSLIEEVLIDHDSSSDIRSAEQSNKNVIANYLLHHLIALRYANKAGLTNDKDTLRAALVYEAMAISYLTDAFSSGHMLLPINKPFSSLQTVNFQEAHNFYGRNGLYVINSGGEAWQTFGDRLMQWFGPTYRHVSKAVVTSLRELLLVFYNAVNPKNLPVCLETWAHSATGDSTVLQSVQASLKIHAGQEYYSILRLPSLLLLPMPISASWSVKDSVFIDSYTTVKDSNGIKTTEIDTNGIRIHRRLHYPQVRKPGLYDPDFEKDKYKRNMELLLPESGVPKWLIPGLLAANPDTNTTKDLIKNDSTIASVRYTQETDYLPSFRGLLLHFGSGVLLENGNDRNLLLGVGYSPFGDLLIINNVSLDFLFTRFSNEPDKQMLTFNAGASIKLPLRIIKAIRLEAGPAAVSYKKWGYRIAAGLEFPIWPLRFTYAGLTSRLMFQTVDIGTTSNGLYFQVILH